MLRRLISAFALALPAIEYAATSLSNDPNSDSRQQLRLHRFSMAVATYAACGVLVLAYAFLGYLPDSLPAWWLTGCVLVNLIFFLIFRLGWNLRCRDPSLTETQLLVSMLAVLVLIYYADEARGTFLMLLPVPMLFGVLRLRLYQMVRIGAAGLLGYACVIALSAHRHSDSLSMAIDLLNLLALSGVMGFVCFMGGYISKVRTELSRSLLSIREMAHQDQLTGVFNRRHFIQTLNQQMARCERLLCSGFSLCVVDIDHFKLINDTFGHVLGDEVLIAVASRIKTSIREVDYFARYGGEEFVVLVEGSCSQLALAACERIRANVEAMQVTSIGELPLRVSIGVADYVIGDNATTLLERADSGLYLAKAAGRNCVEFASPGSRPSRFVEEKCRGIG